MVAASLGIAITGVVTGTTAQEIFTYLCGKFFLGLFAGGGIIVSLTMLIELYPSKYRMWAGKLLVCNRCRLRTLRINYSRSYVSKAC